MLSSVKCVWRYSKIFEVTKSYALDIINMFSYDNIHNLQFWFNILKMWNLLNFVIKTKIPRIPFFLRTNLKLGRFLSDFQNFYFPWHGKLFFPWHGHIFSMTWKYFFTVDHVLESLDSDGKFWCFFPSHGNQNFFSRTWIFYYFIFQDMVPSPFITLVCL